MQEPRKHNLHCTHLPNSTRIACFIYIPYNSVARLCCFVIHSDYYTILTTTFRFRSFSPFRGFTFHLSTSNHRWVIIHTIFIIESYRLLAHIYYLDHLLYTVFHTSGCSLSCRCLLGLACMFALSGRRWFGVMYVLYVTLA
jgi:hypothetical protein